MDDSRLSHLEAAHDWQGLVEELEKGIAATSDPAQKASLHLRLGTVLLGKFLQAVKALKHFQDAFKLNPQLFEALRFARAVYWDLGKINMVQRLLELELKVAQDSPAIVPDLIELGDVQFEHADLDKATTTYARALSASGGTDEDARGCLADVQLDESTFRQHLDMLVQDAEGAGSARLFVRAARIAKRFAPAEVEALLANAYTADPTGKQPSAILETMLAEQDRLQGLLEMQRRILDASSGADRAAAAFKFGVRWVTRHQNAEIGAAFLQEAIENDPTNEGAFYYLRDLWGTKEGSWDKVAKLAEKMGDLAPSSPFALAQAGLVAWKQQGDLIRARTWFERLQSIDPEHPSVAAFEAQIGDKLGGSASAAPAAAAPSPMPAAAAEPAADEDVGVDVAVEEPAAEEPAAAAEPAAPPSAPAEPPAPPAPAAAPTPAAAAPPPAAPAPEPAGASPEKIEELKQKAAKQEQAKRFNEYVKTLVELAEAVPDTTEKVDHYMKAADLYATKFSNAAEAVKCYEAVLNLDPENATAIDFLRQSYEKRRDWEKLIGLMKREASAMPEGGARGAKFLEIAKLATERVKKPEICIELWNEVVANDPENADALNNLAGLHERQKDWEALADVLKKQAEITSDFKQKEVVLGKLGTLYGERLNNDEAAVEAWQQLLALNPQDRKAQEALKKKYLTLGRWDDLEVFYAESGKWDEFIRVLEAQEAKETEDGAKIGLLLKTADLWLNQKQKADRAARAYEKVLSIDAMHLKAAQELVPLYQQANNPKGLAGAIEVKLHHEQDPDGRLILLQEVASLYETKLKDPPKAFERFLAAFEIAPSDDQCIQDVERAARVTGEWDKLVASYKAMIQRADEQGDRDLGIDLRLRLGRVLVDEVKRVDDALAEFRAVYEIDGENAQAIAALERLYRETGRYSELLGIYEKKRDLAGDPAERKQIHYFIAELYVSPINDVPSAILTYNKVLEDEPMDAQALAALDKLYLLQQDWDNYVDVLRKRIEIEDEEGSLVDLKYRLGSTLEKHLSDPAGALENYREILLIDPNNDAARVALEALLTNEALRAEAAGILQEIYEGRGDWEKLIQALEILAAAEGDTAARVALLRKVARTAAENLGDLARAFDAQARALKDDPANGTTRGELEQLASQANAWDKLDTIFSEIAGGLDDARLAREYWMRLAGIAGAARQGRRRGAELPARARDRSGRRRGPRRDGRALSPHGAMERPHRRVPPPHRARDGAAAIARPSTRRWPRSTRASSAAPTRPSRPTGRCSPSTTRRRSRSPRSTGSSAARACGRSSRTTSKPSSASRPRRPSRPS